MKLVIDRKFWQNGSINEGETLLLNSDTGRMCCLGFYGIACGISRAEIADTPSPASLARRKGWTRPDEAPEAFRFLVEWSRLEDAGEADSLMRFNDAAFRNEKERESKIAEIFARNGVEVEFIN